MPYALILMFCLASDGQCHRVTDQWHPHGYATMAACEARRLEMTLVIRTTMRPVHMVSRCEMAGEVV